MCILFACEVNGGLTSRVQTLSTPMERQEIAELTQLASPNTEI